MSHAVELANVGAGFGLEIVIDSTQNGFRAKGERMTALSFNFVLLFCLFRTW